MIYFAMNSRNYGTAGKIGVILYLVDMNNPEKRYMFKQENINVAQGEAKTVTFYGKMLVNPGEYFIQTSYITANGEIVDDNLSTYYNDKITVGTGSDINTWRLERITNQTLIDSLATASQQQRRTEEMRNALAEAEAAWAAEHPGTPLPAEHAAFLADMPFGFGDGAIH